MPIRPRTTFSAAADKLNRLVREINQQQYEAAGQRQVPLSPMAGPDPDAEWALHFSGKMFKSSRPRPAPPEVFPPVQRVDMPKKPVFLDETFSSREKQVKQGGHIGAGLGKAGPRRGLFNRLFRRDN